MGALTRYELHRPLQRIITHSGALKKFGPTMEPVLIKNSKIPLATTELLNSIFAQYNLRKWLHTDPVQFVHQYTNSKDQEVVGLIAALFSYGSAEQIIRAVKTILNPMGKTPYEFLINWNLCSMWPNFYYRFHNEQHLLILLKVIQQILRTRGSIREHFRYQSETYTLGNSRLERALNGTAFWFHEEIKTHETGLWRGLRFFWNAPADNSACKRILMFTRWMVRQDEVDIGLWKWLTPADLVIPVDTHIARLSHQLKLRTGKENKQPSWKMAQEITASLRMLNPNDPTSYDFALTRLGILRVLV